MHPQLQQPQRRRSLSTPNLLNITSVGVGDEEGVVGIEEETVENRYNTNTTTLRPPSILRKTAVATAADSTVGEPGTVIGNKSLRWNEESNTTSPPPQYLDYSQSDCLSDAAESVKTSDVMDKWDFEEETIGKVDDSLSIQTEDEDAISQTSFKESDIVPVSNLDKEMKGFYNRPSIVNILQDENSKSTLNEIISTDPLSRMSQTLEQRRSSVISLQRDPNFPPSGANPQDPLSSAAVSGTSILPSFKEKKKTYGLFEGVYVPCVSSVLGTILFLKVPWILANAGLAFSLLYIFISVICAILTWLSLTSVVTNGLLKSGGTIAIMSRVLGNQFSGSLGLIYFVGFILLLSLHSFAAAHLLLSTVRIYFPYFKMVDSNLHNPYWDLIILSIGFLILLFLLVIIGFRHVVRFELIFLFTTAITILLFVIGCFVTVKPKYGITSAKWSNFVANFPPQYLNGQDFFSVMAVIFPSVVGILAGINRSGHLKHIQRNIPIGTIAALLSSTFVYVLIFILLSFVGNRSEMRVNTSYFALVAFPDFGLSIGTYIVKVGMLIAILGEGLQALVVAPRVVQALVDENIISFIPLHYLVTTTNRESVNMRKATLFSALLAIIPLFLGNLESISTFIAMLILFSFAFLNISTFVASISPNWRPRWVYYHWSLGLFGFAVCAICMFLIGWYWTLVCAVIGVLLYVLIEASNETNAYGEALSGVKLQTALNALYSCEVGGGGSSSGVGREKSSKSNWRPQLLCLVKILPNNTISNSDILNIADQLKKGRGLCVVAAIIEGNYKKKYKVARKEQLALSMKMKEKSIPGFSQVVVAKNFQEGINHLIQNCGLGPLTPNTIVSGFPMSEDRGSARNFVEMLKYAEISRKAVIVGKGYFGEEEEDHSGFIDLYWIIYEGGLELLITFLLQKHKVWRRCKIRIYTVADDTSSLEAIKEGVNDILYHLRFEAECHVLYMKPHDISPFVISHDQREREQLLKPSKKFNHSIMKNVRSMSYHEGLDALEVFSSASIPEIVVQPPNSVTSSATNDDTPGEVSVEMVENNTSRASLVGAASSGGSSADETHLKISNVPSLTIVDYLNTSSRINSIIRQHSSSKDTKLVIVNLPSLTSNLSSMDYVSCLKTLTNNISSKILLIKGSGKEVITHLL